MAQQTDPETRVEISIYDLIKRRSYHLPRDYADRVAQIINQAYHQFLSCQDLRNDLQKRGGKIKYLTTIYINNNGKSNIQFDKLVLDSRKRCISKILTSLSYPPHKLKNKVIVKLPIEISYKVL